MAKTVVASFDSFEDARRVVDDLEAQGFPSGDINLIASQPASSAAARGTRTDPPRAPATDLQGEPDGLRGVSDRETTGSSVATGAVTGGVVGGAAGLLASLAGIAVPGVGPLLAAGPIVAALTGAGVGAVAGGLIGGLRDVGVTDTDAHYYAEAVRRGGALVAIRVEDSRADEAAQLMREHGAIDIDERMREWERQDRPAASTSAGDGVGNVIGTVLADAATAGMAGVTASDAQGPAATGADRVDYPSRHRAGSGSGAHLSDTIAAGTSGNLGSVGDTSAASAMGAGGPATDPRPHPFQSKDLPPTDRQADRVGSAGRPPMQGDGRVGPAGDSAATHSIDAGPLGTGASDGIGNPLGAAPIEPAILRPPPARARDVGRRTPERPAADDNSDDGPRPSSADRDRP